MESNETFIQDLYRGSESINEMRERIMRVTKMLAGCISGVEFFAWKETFKGRFGVASSTAPDILPSCTWVITEIPASRQMPEYVFFRYFRRAEASCSQQIFISNGEPRVDHTLEVYDALPSLVELIKELFPTSLDSLQIYIDAAHASRKTS